MTAAALPGTDGAALWVLPDAVLHVGRSPDPSPHAGSVPCLVVGVDGDVAVEHGDGAVVGRTALVPPGLRHRVDVAGGRTAFLFLDPLGGRLASCREGFGPCAGPVPVGHRAQARAVEVLAEGGDATTLLGVVAPRRDDVGDPRVTSALRGLRGNPDTSARDLARAVGLSESHLLALFARHAGMTLRRYRSWTRMGRVARSVAAGADLTRASADAGFASPSHFSDAFRALFGTTASRLLADVPRIHVGDQPAEPPATS